MNVQCKKRMEWMCESVWMQMTHFPDTYTEYIFSGSETKEHVSNRNLLLTVKEKFRLINPNIFITQSSTVQIHRKPFFLPCECIQSYKHIQLFTLSNYSFSILIENRTAVIHLHFECSNFKWNQYGSPSSYWNPVQWIELSIFLVFVFVASVSFNGRINI